MRNMSFSMTTPQFRDKTKTITRRLGWWFLKPGDIVNGVKKAMGLKKGEKIESIHQIKIISVTPEKIKFITQSDVIKEGFPKWSPKQFIEFLCNKHPKITSETVFNRIVFEYIEKQISPVLLTVDGLISKCNETKIFRITQDLSKAQKEVKNQKGIIRGLEDYISDIIEEKD